jgi:uridine kinase
VRLGQGRPCGIEPTGSVPSVPTVETFASLAEHLTGRPPSTGATRAVAIDGRAGAGKTTFADRLLAAAETLPASFAIVHTDDLSSHDDFFGWWPTLIANVLGPIGEGRAGRHAVYDWEARRVAGEHAIPVCDVLLIEGVGAGRREIARFLAYDIWLEVDVRVAEARGLARDLGEHPRRQRALARFWAEWLRQEAAFLSTERGWERADLLVDGDPWVPHDERKEYVRLP